jgi:hypothetical protein
MVIMRVLVEELLCQAVTGRILVLKCSLSDAHGLLWLCPIVPGMKCHCFLRTQLQLRLPGTGEPPGVAARGPGVCVCAELRLEDKTS